MEVHGDYDDNDYSDDDEMDCAFATDVVSGREKNWAEAQNKLAEETRLKYDFVHDDNCILYIIL